MSDIDSLQSPASLAADIELKAKAIVDRIAELQRRQAELHAQYSTIQELDPKSPQLDPLSAKMDQLGRLTGALARERTELLDSVPVIPGAERHVDALARSLTQDARLIDRVKARLDSVTRMIATADQVLGKLAVLLG